MNIQTDLSMRDFTKYFKANRLGKLYFPNGTCITQEPGPWRVIDAIQFNVNLRDLYKLVTEWKINRTEVPIDDILAVIAFGFAVKYPSYEEVPVTKKKYFLFGQREDTGRKKQVPIQPDNADFLVITRQDLIRQEVLESSSFEMMDGCKYILEGGINLVYRGANQIINGAYTNDTLRISAVREGVPIFYDKARLEQMVQRVGVLRTTPRRLYWDEDNSGYLTGIIK